MPAARIVYGTMQIEAAPSTWTYFDDEPYALYLTHTFFITPLLPLWIKFPISTDAIIALESTASVILAWRVRELIENPFSPGCDASRGQRWWRQSPTRRFDR